MTRALFHLAPAPIPEAIEVGDSGGPAMREPKARTGRPIRRVVKPDGRVVRLVAVTPRCRFGMESEREPRPRTDARGPLPPIPDALVTRIPAQPPHRDWSPHAPPMVRMGAGFDHAQPERRSLDPLALACVRRSDPVAVIVLEGLVAVTPPPRLIVLAQVLALAAQLRLNLPPSNEAVNCAATDALAVLGYRRAPVRTLDRAKQLRLRTSRYLQLRSTVVRVLQRLFVRARAAYAAIKRNTDPHTEC